MRYYANHFVRLRIEEFLGFRKRSRKPPSSVFLVVGNSKTADHLNRLSFRRGAIPDNDLVEISRSMWDRESLIADLDIEYVNFDFPAEPFVHPERIFSLQEPVRLAVDKIFSEFSLKPLHLLTGRGHHYVWQIDQKSAAFGELVEMGRPFYRRSSWPDRAVAPDRTKVGAELSSAFCGLGLLMEFLVHQIKATASSKSAIPVEITAIEIAPGERGSEMISLDISEYGDPLDIRAIRAPFSRYLKPLQQRSSVGEKVSDNLPSIFEIPVVGDLSSSIEAMHDVTRVLALARQTSTKIPDQSTASAKLIKRYQESPLAEFHKLFCSVESTDPSIFGHWNSSDELPGCVRYILEHPNDLLLKPGGVRRVTIALLAVGWHPSRIASLIGAKFEEDHRWGEVFCKGDPKFRADFYTRLFAGLVWLKLDNAIDFNCRSSQQQGWCFRQSCHEMLERCHQSLLNRRSYARLADRPFDRLFFPKAD